MWLYIEGGEPFLRAGFVDLLAENTPRMFTMVRTHGTLIDASPGRAAQGHRRRHHARGPVGRDGRDARRADPYARQLRPHRRRAIRHLVAAGIETQALFILNRLNVHELQDWCELAGSLGATGSRRPAAVPARRRESPVAATGPVARRDDCRPRLHQNAGRGAPHAVMAPAQCQLLLADVRHQCFRRLDRLRIPAGIRQLRQRAGTALPRDLEPPAGARTAQRPGRGQLPSCAARRGRTADAGPPPMRSTAASAHRIPST